MSSALVLDTSALLAILLAEEDASRFAAALAAADELRMAAPSWLETAMVATARGGDPGYQQLQHFLAALGVVVVPADAALAHLAYAAWRRYGKGRHRASLNFGECFSYALAKQRGEALLFKGQGFSATDVQPAID